jgi:tRNA dimethylallyltransferase
MDHGALAEVAALLARSLDPALPVMRAIGIAEIGTLLRGEVSQDEASDRGAQATRNYAKRQYTWFRRQPPEDWPRLETEKYDEMAIFETLLR